MMRLRMNDVHEVGYYLSKNCVQEQLGSFLDVHLNRSYLFSISVIGSLQDSEMLLPISNACLHQSICKCFPFIYISGAKGGASCSVSSKSTSTLSLHTNHATSSGSLKSSGIFREADVFLLCYRISDPGTLFTAINFWCPEIRCHAPTTPIILVGCQSDLRQVLYFY